MPDADEMLDTVLREHFCSELNGQLGRPAAAFLAHAVDASRAKEVVGASPWFSTGPLGPSPNTPPEQLGHSQRSKLKSRWFNSWFIGMAGAALAASIAALWAAPVAFRRHVPVAPIKAIQPDITAPTPQIARSEAGLPEGSTEVAETNGSPAQRPLIQWVQSRTLDEGTVVLDDPDHPVPARKLREQQMEHTQWYDPAKRAQVEMTVPREHIKFVEMDTY